MRARIYMLFPLVGWKKVLFHGVKAGNNHAQLSKRCQNVQAKNLKTLKARLDKG